INDILKGGYTQRDGTIALSTKEKMERGKLAILALSDYKKAKADGNTYMQDKNLKILEANYDNFGYGFLKDEKDIIPNVSLTFYAFRFMVIFGSAFLGLFALLSYMSFKNIPYEKYKLLLWSCVFSIPLAYMVSQSGWIVAEVGRQPWVIQDLMPTSAAVSAVSSNSVITTFIIFCVLFTVMLIAELSIMFKQIKKGF
ncbi:MAG: cytochrome ubiquinol oxidase subunit I, partial [Bacteroidales bacterium]